MKNHQLCLFALGLWMPLLCSAEGECYSTTKSLLEAQIEDINAGTTDTYKEYEICEGAQIDVGIPNAAFSDFTNGDYPIALVRPNAMIKCSGCEIRGGFTQIVALPNLQIVVSPTPILGISIDNSTLQGITFTGDLFNGIPNVSGAGAFIAAPGTLTLLECVWKDFKGSGILSIGKNVAAPQVTPNTIQVEVKSSTFQNIAYGNYLFWNKDTQSLIVSDSDFTNVSYDDDLACGCDAFDYFAFVCDVASTCKFSSNCMSSTTFSVGLFLAKGMSTFELDTESNFLNVASNNETAALCTGLSVYKETNESSSCIDVGVSEEDFCGFSVDPTNPPQQEESSDPSNDESSGSGTTICYSVKATIFLVMGASLWW